MLLFAVLLVGGGLMVFGPKLAARYEFAARLLGDEEPRPRTLADGRPIERDETNPLLYVGFTFVVTGFFLFFVSPMLSSRARRTRHRVLVGAVGRFPFLTPLLDPDQMSADGMEELRALGEEAKARSAQIEGALEIQPLDWAKQADPSDLTVTSNDSPVDLSEFRAMDPERTVSAEPKPTSERMRAIRGNDEIPFSAVSPSAKPQMEDLGSRPRTDRMFEAARPRTDRMFEMEDPTITSDDGGPGVGELLESAALGIVDESDATVVRESGPQPIVRENADTLDRHALPRNQSDLEEDSRELAATLKGAKRGSRGGGMDPDATTHPDWESH